MASPRVLLLTHRLKEYWASPYGRSRTARVLTPGDLRLPERLRRHRQVAQLALALHALPVAAGYDVVVCVDRGLAQPFGALKQLARLKAPLIAHQFILPDSDDARRKPFAAAWDRLACRGISRVIVNASHEIAAYSKRLGMPGRVVFVPLAIDTQAFQIQPAVSGPQVFSGGIALRDYGTLFQAVGQDDLSVEVVVYSPANLPGRPPPGNTRVRYALPFADFLQAMASARLVVIPLYPTQRSAGQGTIAFAQAMGKAVIASDVAGVRDYITHGVTGWLVRPEDPGQLRQAIRRLLADPSLRSTLEEAARSHALAAYSYAGYDVCMAKIIQDVFAGAGG
jgi:glycosyltransferase involved in cell wall biosynthesis